jgi:putative flippase GtrA
VEVLTVVAANLAATAVRFLLFRLWVFRGNVSNRTTKDTTSTETAAS